jgi:L-methionine (R)-S-oxide reductase
MMIKEEQYMMIIKQVNSLIESETDIVANMANITALLKSTFDFWWCGFYIVRGNQLVLGPFQGPLACTRIGFGKGVCGTAWKEKKTIIVNDVEKFPGHIACSSESRSEIVIPIFIENDMIGEIDIDSRQLNNFDNIDAKYLEILAKKIGGLFTHNNSLK